MAEDKIDFLDVDNPINGQNYCCMSFLDPDDVFEDKNAFIVSKFLQSVCKSENMSFDKVMGQYKDFTYKYEDDLQKEYDEKNKGRCNVRGVKVRGIFQSKAEADARASRLHKTDSNFHVFVGQVGYWLPWDPNPLDVKNLEYQENELNTLMKKYNENMEHREYMFDEERKMKLDKAKKENEEKKRTLDEIAHEIEQKGEKEQVQLSKQLETLRIDIAKNRERINSCKNEIERISQRRDQLDESYKEIDGKITNFDTEKSRLQQEINTKEKEKEQVNGSIEKFKQKNKLGKDLEQVDQEVEGIDSRSEELQKSIDELREKQQELIREKDKLEFMCGSVDERIKKVEEIDKEHKKELDDLKRKREEFKHSTLELNKKLNEDSTLAASSINIKRELAGYEEELSKLSVRQAGLKEVSMQNHAVQRILDNKELGKVYGTVSQLGSVSSKYSTALEIAAGGRINSLIVEDDSVAARCIKFLKERKHGVATFLPLNKLKSVEINSEVNRLKSANGVVDLAINLVSFDNKFKKAFSYVLGNTLIVNDVEVGRRVGIGKARMVTLEGDVIETSGAMQGGFRGKRKGIGFNEVEVGRNITTLEEKVGNLRAELSGIMRRRDENEELIQKLRSRKAELEGGTADEPPNDIDGRGTAAT